ncbi:MAG: hypothetical protein WCF20_10920 [Methylovirgula sp.]
MTSFTFSAEQVNAAPPEVRRWMENEIVRALSGARPSAAPQPPEEAGESLERALATASAEEMQETFERISGNSIVARVFFELARETPFVAGAAPFHVVDLGEMMRHLQPADAKQLFACFNVINQAFQAVRRDPEASLFAFDEAGHLYLHETTYRSIRQVWQQLVVAHPWPATGHMAEMPLSGLTPAAALRTMPVGNVEEPLMRPEHAFPGTSND